MYRNVLKKISKFCNLHYKIKSICSATAGLHYKIKAIYVILTLTFAMVFSALMKLSMTERKHES